MSEESRDETPEVRMNRIAETWWVGLGAVYKGVDLGESVRYDLFQLLLREKM